MDDKWSERWGGGMMYRKKAQEEKPRHAATQSYPHVAQTLLTWYTRHPPTVDANSLRLLWNTCLLFPHPDDNMLYQQLANLRVAAFKGIVSVAAFEGMDIATSRPNTHLPVYLKMRLAAVSVPKIPSLNHVSLSDTDVNKCNQMEILYVTL
jgi:hypothetical protein